MGLTYFISGHRVISQEEFDTHYVPKIDLGIEMGVMFLIGDYEGVDAMAQQYLFDKGYESVTIFHMFASPRVNAGFIHLRGGFKNDEERDNAMTNHSNHDIAWVRPGKEGSGTAQNVMRRSISKLFTKVDHIEFDQARPFALHKKYRKMFTNIGKNILEEWAKASGTYVEKDDTTN
jgi:hypothetical protein